MIFKAKTKCPQDRMSPLFTLVCRFPGCQIDRAKSPHSCNPRLINRCFYFTWNWKQIVVIRHRQSKTWFSASIHGFLNAQSQNFVCTHKLWKRAHNWKEKVQQNKTEPHLPCFCFLCVWHRVSDNNYRNTSQQKGKQGRGTWSTFFGQTSKC